MAITGRGAKLNNWALRLSASGSSAPMLTRKLIQFGDSDNADGLVFTDWFFDSASGQAITGTMSATLDDITVSFNAVSGHPTTLAVLLDDITASLAATVGHTATIALQLDDINSSIGGTAGHAAQLQLVLDDILINIEGSIGGNVPIENVGTGGYSGGRTVRIHEYEDEDEIIVTVIKAFLNKVYDES